MLTEMTIWATSRAAPSARKAGLVSEVAGIAGRYKRQKKAWAHHLTQTKSFIEDNLHHAIEEKPILVLGAGLCLDIPLDRLNQHAAGVILADAVFPLSTQLKVRSFKNIKLMCGDLTGFLQPFWNTRQDDKISPPTSAPLPKGEFGMVISCNILSQLPLSFSSSPPVDEIEMRLTAAIQLAHMRALENYPCPILLLTDYERHEKQKGEVQTIATVSPQLLPGDPIQNWRWHIAPEGEVSPGLDVSLTVGGWLLSSR